MADERKTRELELDLRLSLVGVLVSPKGWDAPVVQEQMTRARVLGEQLGDRERLIRVMFGKFARLTTVSHHDLALDTARELIELAEAEGSKFSRAVAFTCMGMNACIRGELFTSRDCFQRSFKFHDPLQIHTGIAFAGYDVALMAANWHARALAVLGYASQSQAIAKENIEQSNLLSHVPTIAQVQFSQMILNWISCDYSGMANATEKIRDLAATHKLQFYNELSNLSAATVQVEIGNSSENIQRLSDGLITYRKLGYGMHVPFFLLCIARACLKFGEIENGLMAIFEALSLSEVTLERLYDFELHRVKGNLMLLSSRPDVDQAEKCFLSAIKIAQQQGAKTWELRAATNLARLRRNAGRHAEAFDVLEPVYSWFTEGLDLPDLQDASAVLAAIAQRLPEPK